MAANKKINLNIDIKTTFTDISNTVKKFKDQISSLTDEKSKGAFTGLEKSFASFEKQLEGLSTFKLNSQNIEQYESKIRQLNDTYENIAKTVAEIGVEEQKLFNKDKETATAKINELQAKLETQQIELNRRKTSYEEKKALTIDEKDTEAVKKHQEELAKAKKAVSSYQGVVTKTKNEISKQTNEVQELSKVEYQESEALKKSKFALGQVTIARDRLNMSMVEAREEQEKIRRQETQDQIQSQVKRWTSLAIAVTFARKQLNQMKETYLDLDASLTQIAVVSGKTRDQMWDMIGTYNQMAQRLGVTTKDVVESSKLYYQQGRSQSEVMKLVEQTTILASISELDFADATNYMTAAINGFKLSAEDAINVTDTWANLAAQSAVDTNELAIAISKVASIAQSAGMDINSTSAFLSKMIETTREAPENLGTALKTVIARFQELKTATEDLGDGVDVNKVEKALKKADVALRNTSGQFRDFDDVIMELSSKWDGLDRNTQRYIATIAAGSRQQSRFIALVEDYKRNVELMDIANNSAGASAAQFATQLTGLEASFNRLKAAWEGLYTSWSDGSVALSVLVDSLANLVSMFSEIGLGGTALIGVFSFLLIKIGATAAVTMSKVAADTLATGSTIGFTAALKAGTLGLKAYTTSMGTAAASTLALVAPIAIVVAIVGTLMAVVAALVTAQERHIKKLQEQADASHAAAAAATQEVRSLESLKKEYEEAYKNGENLTEVKQKIIDQYPELRAMLEDENVGYEQLNSKLEEYIRLKNIEAGLETVKGIGFEREGEIKTLERQIKELESKKRNLEDIQPTDNDEYYQNVQRDIEKYSDSLNGLNKQLIELKKNIFTSADRTIISKGIIAANEDLQQENASEIASLLLYGTSFEDLEEKIDENNEKYLALSDKKTEEIINNTKNNIDKINSAIESAKGTEDEPLLTNFVQGNISELSSTDWNKLAKQYQIDISGAFKNIKASWDSERKRLNEQLKESGLIDVHGELPAALSNEMAAVVSRAIEDSADEDKAKITEYYKTVFSDAFKAIGSIDGKMVDITPQLQSIDITNLEDVERVLGQIQQAGLEDSEAFELLARSADFTDLSFNKLDSSMSSFANTLSTLQDAVETGLGVDELGEMLIGLDMTLDDVSYSFDISSGKMKLSADSAAKLANAQNELAISETETAIATMKAAVAQIDSDNQILSSLQSKLVGQAKAAEGNLILQRSTVDLTAQEAELIKVITGEAPAWSMHGDVLRKTSEQYLALAGQIGEAISKNNSEKAALEKNIIVSGQLNEVRKQNVYSAKDFTKTTSAAKDAETAEMKAIQAQIKALEDQQKALKNQMSPYEREIELLNRDIEAREYQIKLLERQKKAIQDVIDAVEKEQKALEDKVNKEKEVEEARIDAAIRRLEILKKLAEAGLDPNAEEYKNKTIEELEEIAKAAKNASDEQERLMAIEKAREALENAKNQKTMRVYYEDRGWVWEANQQDILDAQEKLDEALQAQKDAAQQAEIDKIQDLIEQYEKMKEEIGLTLTEKQLMEQFDKEFASMNYRQMIGDLDKYVNERVPYYQQMNQQIADYDTRIEELNGSVEKLDLSIEELEKENDALKAKIEDIQEVLRPMKNAYDDLGNAVSSLRDKYNELKDAANAAAEAQAKAGATNFTTGGFHEPEPKMSDFNADKKGSLTNAEYAAYSQAHTQWLMRKKAAGFEQGGIVDYTGPAVVHGSKSRPELFLNNSQAAVLFKMLSNKASIPGGVSKIGPTNFSSVTNSETKDITYFKNCKIEVTSDADSIDDLIKDIESKTPITTLD